MGYTNCQRRPSVPTVFVGDTDYWIEVLVTQSCILSSTRTSLQGQRGHSPEAQHSQQDVPKNRKWSVIKFFDSVDRVRRGNVPIMTSAGVVVKEQVMTMDRKVSYLEYAYYDGVHQPVALQQFHNIVWMLHKVHSCGFVHGDIRLSNLVFNRHG